MRNKDAIAFEKEDEMILEATFSSINGPVFPRKKERKKKKRRERVVNKLARSHFQKQLFGMAVRAFLAASSDGIYIGRSADMP